MNIRSLVVINTLVGFILFSCANNLESKKNQIIIIVDSIGNKVIPDKRLAVWNCEISDTNGVLHLKIESDQKSGIVLLEKELKAKFPELKLKTSLLSYLNKREESYGLINISAGNIRKSPKHNSELVTQELMGAPVKVLKEEDGWYLIQSPNGYIGWIDGPGISLRNEFAMNNLSLLTFGLFTKQFGLVYRTTKKEEIVSDIVLGNIIKVTENLSGFYAVELPDGRKGFIEKDGIVNLKLIFNQTKIDTNELVRLAKTFMGVSYMWGGKSSKAIDCSGFTSLLYFFSGIILQRDASQQINHGELVDPGDNFSNFKAGDLLFFGRKATNETPERVIHVGICIGNDDFIHSSGFVRISSLNTENPNFDSGYKASFLRARRIINSIGSERIQKIEDNELYKYFCK